MFGHRSDGKLVKDEGPIFRIIPLLMKNRSDSQVFFKQDIGLSTLDEYMDKKAKEGVKLSYMDIIYTVMLRTIAERPKLNRFIAYGRPYQRNQLVMSLMIKKGLNDDSEETLVKLKYRGDETLLEVRDKLQKCIDENKDVEAANGTDKLIKALQKLPFFIYKIAVGTLMWMDKHGILPKAVIDVSPFHTSAFLTNMGSLGIDSIYHHIYDFGTTSMFLSMGKKKKSFVYDSDKDDIIEDKSITLAFVGDERICDGYYYARSFRNIAKYLRHPELLEEKPEIEITYPVD